MNCTRCATPIPEHSSVCVSCGALVSDPSGTHATPGGLDEAAARELEQLLREETTGEYEIEREIAHGGMGVVYLAREVHLARRVAIKVLPPNLTFGKGAIGRFRREAMTAAALDHPNIIPIYRITPGGKLFWYAMKFIEGHSLADVLREKKLFPLGDTILILERVADALDYAHERQVIHRDIKPANVMLDNRGRVVLTDFGIAKELAAGTLTGSGSVLGTPFYMSPEQCRDGPLTGAADQYSVGVMAYQMLSGQVPFDSRSVVDLLQKHCVESPPPLDLLRPGLPEHVYLAVQRAMAKDSTERFPTVGAFARALKGPTEVATLKLPKLWALKQRASGTVASVRHPRRPWILGAGLTVLVIAGVAAAALWWPRLSLLRQQVAAGHAADTQRTAASPVGAVDTSRSTVARPQPAQPESSAGGARVEAKPPAVKPPTPSQPPAQSSVLVIQTTGGWARIYVDGVLRREGTSHRETLPPGSHTLHFERPGYAPVDTTVTLRRADTLVVRVGMRTRP